MTRTNRLAHTLVDMDRTAARPFPLTDRMKRIVVECSDRLYKILNGIEPPPSPPPYPIYEGDLSVSDRSFKLRVVVDREPFKLVLDQAREDEAGDLEIYINIPMSFSDDGSTYKNPEFWASFRRRLLHELIHAHDPKSRTKSIREKMPEYVHPLHGNNYEGYLGHPIEQSANEGQNYYYFLDAAERGLSLKESLHNFFHGYHGLENVGTVNFRDMMKRKDPKTYNDYKTRVYKSAVQAYEDAAKEQATLKV